MDAFLTVFTIPDTLSNIDVILMAVISFFTSLLTAAVGIGGGIVLLAVMAQFLPVLAIVPVHGAVQLGSNVGRTYIMKSDVNWRLVAYFFLGSLVGALVGGQVAVTLPVTYLQLLLALFILYSTWGPKLSVKEPGKKGLFACGALSTLLSMFVGATGAFVSVVIKRMNLGKLGQVASMSACNSIQHTLKVAVFWLLGFSFAPYLPFIGLLIVSGFIGTLVGRRLLERASEVLFTKLLSVVLTVLALRLLWTAGTKLMGA